MEIPLFTSDTESPLLSQRMRLQRQHVHPGLAASSRTRLPHLLQLSLEAADAPFFLADLFSVGPPMLSLGSISFRGAMSLKCCFNWLGPWPNAVRCITPNMAMSRRDTDGAKLKFSNAAISSKFDSCKNFACWSMLS